MNIFNKITLKMIILIGSEKGGVGKSTLATNLATALALKGSDIILVDADRQSTSANWSQDRKETEKQKVQCVRQYGDIEETIADLSKRYQYVLVDCQGRDGKELRSGLMVADLLIIPSRPSQPDLDTVPVILDSVSFAARVNKSLKVCCVLTMTPTNPKITETEDSKLFLEKFTNVKVLKTTIGDRKTYRDAISEGLSVIEKNDSKASFEIENLLEEILNYGEN
jgi:chromosome partitioning protein